MQNGNFSFNNIMSFFAGFRGCVKNKNLSREKEQKNKIETHKIGNKDS